MTEVFKLRPNQPLVWFHRDPIKSNQYCLYCGAQVGVDSSLDSDKEHLIGREFVPTGSLNGGRAFNLIFRACRPCNADKAELERHISSVTLFDSPGRVDPGIDAIAKNKATKDFHPLQRGVAVDSAHQRIKLRSKAPGMRLSVEYVGPPQLAPGAAEDLAFYHVQGLFSAVTSENPTVAPGTSLLPERHFIFHRAYRHSDWGNPELEEFARRTADWAQPVAVTTANGFFRALMRQGPTPEDGWLWALEWNKSLRLVGAIGNPESPPALLGDLPDLGWTEYKSADGRVLRRREEVPLADVAPDSLFGF